MANGKRLQALFFVIATQSKARGKQSRWNSLAAGIRGLPRCFTPRNGQGGFTYLSLLFAVVVIGIALSAAAEVWTTISKREMEEELLFKGREFKNAIDRYYNSSPGVTRFPRELKELLKDPRHPAIKRYLRKIYVDPMTGKSDWQLIKEKDGTIIGVKSSSTKTPLKTANFPSGLEGFEGKTGYNEWEFAYKPTKEVKTPKK